MTSENKLMKCADVMDYLGVSESSAYKIIRSLNEELAKKGYYIIPGRISKKYLDERFFGEAVH